MKITRREIEVAVMVLESRLSDTPNTLSIIRRYIMEREAERNRAPDDRLGDGSRVPMPGDDDGWGDE